MDQERRPRRRERVLAQQVSGALVLLHLDTGQYYTLNEVGGRAWDLCNGTRTVAEMVSLLAQEYDAPAAAIEADLGELLENLAGEQLVVSDP